MGCGQSQTDSTNNTMTRKRDDTSSEATKPRKPKLADKFNRPIADPDFAPEHPFRNIKKSWRVIKRPPAFCDKLAMPLINILPVKSSHDSNASPLIFSGTDHPLAVSPSTRPMLPHFFGGAYSSSGHNTAVSSRHTTPFSSPNMSQAALRNPVTPTPCGDILLSEADWMQQVRAEPEPVPRAKDLLLALDYNSTSRHSPTKSVIPLSATPTAGQRLAFDSLANSTDPFSQTASSPMSGRFVRQHNIEQRQQQEEQNSEPTELSGEDCGFRIRRKPPPDADPVFVSQTDQVFAPPAESETAFSFVSFCPVVAEASRTSTLPACFSGDGCRYSAANDSTTKASHGSLALASFTSTLM